MVELNSWLIWNGPTLGVALLILAAAPVPLYLLWRLFRLADRVLS